MIYENNLESLKKNHNTIYREIIKKDFSWEQSKAFVEVSKNGEKIIAYCDENRVIYLNSRYNPSSEAEKYLNEIYDLPEQSILTMYGFANGCFAQDALKKTHEQVLIIVYEPSVSVFMQSLYHIDITEVLNNGRLILIVEGINSEYFDVVLGRALRGHNKNNSKFMSLPKYSDLFSESYKKYADKIQGAYNKLQLYNDTAVCVGDIICKNDILNLKYIEGCRCGMDYKGHFPEDMPAIIVSAGPSLAKNKHLLREAKGKALIIVVDTAIASVMSMGVQPDMVITVDFDKDLKYFDAEGLDQIPFIIEPDSSNRVLKKVNPKNIIFFGTDVLLWSNLFKECGAGMYFLDIGGSVATYAIATAIAWNFKKIILIGQDLAFTGGSVHVGEASQEYDFSTGKYSYIKSVDGEELVTRSDYLTYLRWIEQVAYSNPQVEIIDATEGGAYIEYTKVMDFKDAINLYCTIEYNINALINATPVYFSDNGKQVVKDKLTSVKNNLRKMKRVFIEGSIESHKGSVMLSRGDYNIKELKRINASMEKVDNMFIESEERELLSRLSAAADYEFEEDMFQMETDDIKESIRMYNKCEKYYRKLGEAIPTLLEFIDTCLIELDA